MMGTPYPHSQHLKVEIIFYVFGVDGRTIHVGVERQPMHDGTFGTQK
jgi:hypothetical protein